MTSSDSERKRRWAKNNPVSVKAAKLKRYGLTVPEYLAIYDEQGGVCAICNGPETVVMKGKIKALSVDHEHTTGHVRGLLCQTCNFDVGKIEKLIEQNRVTKIIEYIATHVERYELTKDK